MPGSVCTFAKSYNPFSFLVENSFQLILFMEHSISAEKDSELLTHKIGNGAQSLPWLSLDFLFGGPPSILPKVLVAFR